MLSIAVSVMYVAAAILLAAGAFRVETQASGGKRLAGLGLGLVGLIAHGVDLSQAILTRPSLALNAADTASLIGWILAIIAIFVGLRRPRFVAITSLLLLITAVVAVMTDEGAR